MGVSSAFLMEILQREMLGVEIEIYCMQYPLCFATEHSSKASIEQRHMAALHALRERRLSQLQSIRPWMGKARVQIPSQPHHSLGDPGPVTVTCSSTSEDHTGKPT